MIDPRFYEVGSPLKASEIAEIAGAEFVRGDPGRLVASIASAEYAGSADLTFVDAEGEDGTEAGVIIGRPGSTRNLPATITVLESEHPRSAFGRAGAHLVRIRELEPGQPNIHPSARIASSAVVEPGCVIGPGVAIGADCRIGANTVIGPGVQIGARTRIGAVASVKCALIGDGVVVFAGAIIGETGFGLAAAATGGAALSPHFGRVIIQNSVTIGANTCVDRGQFDDTVIGEASQIDNLCHIGHNCRIGSGVVIAGFGAVSGSSAVGDGVQFGGRVGIKDHVTVGAGARLGAGSAVMNDVPAGETWAGYPAKRLKTWFRELAWVSRQAQKRPGKNE